MTVIVHLPLATLGRPGTPEPAAAKSAAPRAKPSTQQLTPVTAQTPRTALPPSPGTPPDAAAPARAPSPAIPASPGERSNASALSTALNVLRLTPLEQRACARIPQLAAALTGFGTQPPAYASARLPRSVLLVRFGIKRGANVRNEAYHDPYPISAYSLISYL